VFSVTGAGTVIAGTVLDGVVETGEPLVLSPRGQRVRVRGLQSGGQTAARVEAGQRCAVNLAGVELADVGRGDWLMAPVQHAPTSRLEARLRVLPTKATPLRHNTHVHLHLGAADLGARILIPGQKAIAPGDEAIVHFVLDAETAAVTGDRFIVRDQAGRASIGGGVVIDPFVTPIRDRTARAPVTAALDAGDVERALAALLAVPGHETNAQRFERSFNLPADKAQALYKHANAVELNGLLLPAARADALSEEITTVLAEFHRDKPDAEGMNVGALKKRLAAPPSTEAFLALLHDLQEKRRLVSIGSVVKLHGHAIAMSPADTAMWRKLLPWLEELGATPFTVRELARDAGTSEPVMSALVHRKRVLGEVWRVTEERYLLREQVAALAARADALASEIGGGGFTAAQYRDAIGTGRTWAIHILEFFDSIGVTRRKGDLRRIAPQYPLVVGDAAPYTPAPKKTRG
jgi:selenocysteine-specific elongation factor